MKNKVLIHSLVFSPDSVSTAYLYNDIALTFQKRGFEVVVLTTTPHYNIIPSHVQKQSLIPKWSGLYYESNYHGIKVIHVPQKKFKNTFLRLMGFLYWHIFALFWGLKQKNIDIILSPSPPLTIGIINIWISKIKKCKVIYNVQEIYPDILKKDKGWIWWLLKKTESYVYNHSTAVTTIDQVFYDIISPRFQNNNKLHIIPNFVDTFLYRPIESLPPDKLDRTYFPDKNSLKLLYAGNIGYAQDWEPLIVIAEKVKGLPIDFFVIGEGVMKAYLEEKIREKSLNNIHLLPYQERALMPYILSYTDLQFIFMHPDSDKNGFPSKVYTIMACAKPMLILAGDNTPIVHFLKPHNCAKLITEQNFNKKVELASEWIKYISREELKYMGANGLVIINKSYAKDIITNQYVDLALSLL